MTIRKQRSLTTALFASLGLAGVTLLSGCGGGGSGDGSIGSINTTQSTGVFGSLQFTTTVPKVTALGSTMTIAYKISNAGSANVSITFPATFQDSLITQGTATIWQASKASMPLPGTETIVLHPGESRSTTVIWDEKDLNHKAVGPGQYTITAWSPITNVNGTAYTLDQAQVNFSPAAMTVSVL